MGGGVLLQFLERELPQFSGNFHLFWPEWANLLKFVRNMFTNFQDYKHTLTILPASVCPTFCGVLKAIMLPTSWCENCKAPHLFLTNWHEGRFHSVKIQAIVIRVFKQTFSIRWLNTTLDYTHNSFQSWHPNRWFQFLRTENVLMSVVGKQAIIVHVKNYILSFNKYHLLQKNIFMWNLE